MSLSKWWEANKDKPVVKGVLEALRLVVLALIPFLIDKCFKLNLPPEVLAGIVTLLRFIDKTLHTIGKQENNELLLRGLTRF